MAVFIALWSFSFTPAQEGVHSLAGTEEFSFLSQATNSQAAGTAQAYTAHARGIDAIGINPGALAYTQNQAEFSGSYRLNLLNVHSGNFAFAHNLPHRLQAAGSFSFIQHGAIPHTDVNGNSLGEDIKPVSAVPALTMAWSSGNKIHAGVTAKLPAEFLGYFSGSQWGLGWGLDAGLLIVPNTKQFKIGLSMLNLGRKLQSQVPGGQTGGLLPLTWNMGLMYHPLSLRRTTVLADINIPHHNHPFLNAGAEYRLSNYVTLRGGGRLSIDEYRYFINKHLFGEDVENTPGASFLKAAAGATFLFAPYEMDVAAQYHKYQHIVTMVTIKYRI